MYTALDFIDILDLRRVLSTVHMYSARYTQNRVREGHITEALVVLEFILGNALVLYGRRAKLTPTAL
jgi:hypothetical protein